jgi:tetratricopeptide (TPR) repeat protein
VVVGAFQTPPALAAEGLNGTVVASKLLDRLRALQANTQAAAAYRGIKDAWSSDIKVELPQTGVSIGELERYLHDWLGHELHVGGDLEIMGDRVVLTVRGEGFEAKSFEGARRDLPQLVASAAEYIYGEAEPYLAATYLSTHGRDADAVQLVQAKYASARPADRPFLLNAWGNALVNLGRVPDGVEKYAEALRIKPDYWIADSNAMAAQWDLGREEDAWRTGTAMARAAGRGQIGQRTLDLYFQPLDTLTWNLPALRTELIADLEKHGGVGSGVTQTRLLVADALARMHDPHAAELYLETSADVGSSSWVTGMTHFVHGWEALDRADWVRAADEMGAFDAIYAADLVSRSTVPGYDCWRAPAEEMAGRPERADAAITAGGRFVDCYRFRADILDHRGDWAGAQKAYGEAVALAPDLPAAYYSWGLALARHGNPIGAAAKYAAANARGPHWADPLKAWGDALAAQGHWSDAAKKYAQASAYAPQWSALQVALAEARRHTGR